MESAFPLSVLDDVRVVLDALGSPALPPSVDTIGPVVISGERLQIPARVYFRVDDSGGLGRLTARQVLIWNCIYTRHHDGYVRERALRRIIDHHESWIAPFVVQLVAEYIVEIIRVIEESLTDEHAAEYTTFLNENPAFFALTRQRVVSYWQCYYRREFASRERYPGFRMLSRFERWTRRTPAPKAT